MTMARKLFVLAAAAFAGAAQGHTFDKIMQTKTVKATADTIQIPASGGTRPVGHFGVASGPFLAGTRITFHADASMSGGMFIKGMFLSKAKYDEFVSACTQPGDNKVSVYEWGYGSCDDWNTLQKAANTPAFTATVNPKPDGSGATIEGSADLTEAYDGLYVVFENLMGMPLTFTNAQIRAGTAPAANAGAPLEFPAATVHMSAAVVYAGDHAIVDTATVAFNAKGTTPYQSAKPTAVMALSVDDMAPERLGCALGFYFGWFKNNVAGRDVCKGADFEVEILGDVLTLKGTIRAVPPEQAGVELAGDIQITPATAYFQGDSHYTFTTAPHGTEGFYVLIPNRLDTPLTIQKFSVTTKFANLLGLFTSPKQALESGPIAGIVIVVLLATAVLVTLGYKVGKCRGAAAVGRAQSGAAMV